MWVHCTVRPSLLQSHAQPPPRSLSPTFACNMASSSAPRSAAVTSDPSAECSPPSSVPQHSPSSPSPSSPPTSPSPPQPPQPPLHPLPPELRSPMYVPSDSSNDEVQYVATHAAPKPSEQLSDHVRITLQQLELRNAILSLPFFNRTIPFSADDKAVAAALADMRRARLETQSASLLILTTSLQRARRWRLLLNTHSELLPFIHFPDRPINLDRLLRKHGVVIAHITHSLVSAKHRQLSLRKLALLVIDSAEKVTDRAHATAVLIRDFYKALPERVRPRILAIARTHIPEPAMHPLEYNLLSHFVSANVTQDVRWLSCLGKGSRPAEAGLIDLEYLYYHPSAIDNNEPHAFGKRRSMHTQQERDRRGYSEIDHLVDQVGPLGVAAYTKVKEYKRERRRYPGKLLPDKLYITDKDALVGLTSKALSLINEIHLAYAASTRSDRLAAIVYAGRPVVACALCEIVRAFPIFRGLCARVALGVQSDSTYQKDSRRDDFEDMKWQGEDTDDEEVSSFTAGETNVLFVATPFCSKTKRQRPLPPTPLVLRFDGSSPDPETDGGGGRCRVVVFREHDLKRHARVGNKVVITEAEKDNVGKENTAHPARSKDDVAPKTLESPDHSDEGTLRTKTPNGSLRAAPPGSFPDRNVLPASEPANQWVQGQEEESHVYHCAPAKPLLGPTPNSGSPAFLYRILLFDRIPGSQIQEEKKARESGIEDFLLAFSSKVAEEDVTISLADVVHGTRNGTNSSGYLKLDFQGSITLTAKEVNQARQYTENMFCLLLPHLHKTSFVWDNAPAQHGSNSKENLSRISRCRNYLVLPGKFECNHSNEEDEVQIVSEGASPAADLKKLSGSALVISKYFGHPSDRGNVKRVFGPCKIDWETVHTFLRVLDMEKYREDARKSVPLKPEEFEVLEGKLLFSTLSGGIFAMSGRLRYDLTPLTQFTRSRKFPLNEDGTFMKHEDLVHLVNVVVSKETIEKQEQANISKPMSLSDSENIEQHTVDLKTAKSHCNGTLSDEQGGLKRGSTTLNPVKWSQARGCLILDTPVLGKRKRSSEGEMKFDCHRNVKKKRKTWVGQVRYSNETYFNKYNDNPIRILDQPLLDTSRHRVGNVENLLEVVRGTSMAELCERFVATGTEKHLIVPEVALLFPLSVGAILLPPVLLLVEKHLSICELRAFYDSKTKVKGTPNELLQAVTSSAANSSKNYERLELLGDSVLKLSCTVRQFTKHPHYTEGQMHHARAHLVSNARLHRRGERRGLFNYVRFQLETCMDWLPPGTDLDGRAQRLTIKGLADVVEAICGVYFLFGSRMDDRKSEDVEILDSRRAEAGSDWEVDLTYDSFLDDSDDDEDEQQKTENKEGVVGTKVKDLRKNASERKGSVNDRSRNSTGVHPLSAASVERGYIAGYKFLEACSIFDDHEPSHSEILLSAAHAMLPKGSKAPQELNGNAFPRDDRLLRPSKPWDEEYGILEKHIGYKFKRRPLLLCAITHGSYIKKDHRVIGDEQTFQRLEFLGDAVADFCVVRYLYEKYPELGPGELTELKGNVVSNEAFARTTVALGLHKFLCHASIAMTEEIESYIGTVTQDLTVDDELGAHGDFKRSLGEIAAPKVLGDIFEAILGAVFVDAGLQQAWRICMKLLGDSLRINADPHRQDMHPCTELMELATGVWKLGQQPRYDTRDVQHKFRGEGNTRARLGSKKVASVYILNEKVAEGHGSTVKRAKLKAAVAAMQLLKDKDAGSQGGRLLRRLKEKAVKREVAERRHSWS